MSKVVGARVNDSLYKKIKGDGRTNTIIIREALTKYYFNDEKRTDVNGVFTGVNNKKNNDKYKIITEEIDKM